MVHVIVLRFLTEIDFFRKECLFQVYGHCLVKNRNILPSDFVVIGTRFINLLSSLDDTSMWGPPDEMIVSCSEPIIARCLTKKIEVDFENCSNVVDNIFKYLIFSRGMEEALCLLKLISMENRIYPALDDKKSLNNYILATTDLRPFHYPHLPP